MALRAAFAPAAAALLVFLLLAGCTSPGPADTPIPSIGGTSPPSGLPSASPIPYATTTPAAPRSMTLRGVVVDQALHPLPTANVTLIETRTTQHVTAFGEFRFEGLDPGVYNLRATAPGYRESVLSVTPQMAEHPIHFVLEARPSSQPYNVTVHVHGIVQCALEVVIMSPSCDSAITYVGGPPVFGTNSTFELPLEEGWRTVVTDVEFNPDASPGFDGMRVTVQGVANQSAVGIYEQYGRFNGTAPFTFRLEPGATYPEGTLPVPANTTLMRFQAFPHSHAWHAACAPGGVPGGPPEETCFLGAGAGVDVEFDLYMTLFYGKPAPEGFTLRK